MRSQITTPIKATIASLISTLDMILLYGRRPLCPALSTLLPAPITLLFQTGAVVVPVAFLSLAPLAVRLVLVPASIFAIG